MWGYYDSEAMDSVRDIYWFETREEAERFVKLATKRQIEEYPDEPETWDAFLEDRGGIIFEAFPIQTAEEAVAEWFGDDLIGKN